MPDSIRDWISFVSEIIGALGIIPAGYAGIRLYLQRKEKQRLNQIVSVMLECTETKQKIVPLMLVRRKDITRAELQGILGTIKMKEDGKRYKLNHLNTKEFWADIERLQASDNKDSEHDKLVIPCSSKEIEQFDSDVVKPL
ncbi:MAG: hypothetical protein JW764_01115 [Chlorobiaceae bacterium]|nr:hypothetical protein [Chlorobiaceae bacterium]